MTPQQFEDYLRIASQYRVTAFKLGELAVQFEPTPIEGPLAEEPSDSIKGGWKRGPDLTEIED